VSTAVSRRCSQRPVDLAAVRVVGSLFELREQLAESKQIGDRMVVHEVVALADRHVATVLRALAVGRKRRASVEVSHVDKRARFPAVKQADRPVSNNPYKVGQKVLPSQALPGDLIFYGPEGSQSVALFIGNGQMVEATDPAVTVSPVRTSGMTPYLTRIIA